MKTTAVASLLFFVWIGVPLTAAGQTMDHHVSGRLPVQGSAREMAAERATPGSYRHRAEAVSPDANPWTLQATLPGAVIHDISFANSQVGYAAAELGQVWKTTDGGAHWTEILNVGFPYYWFGVKAQSTRIVVISGFNDSSFEGVIRWSKDGGATWSSDIVLNSDGWSYRVRRAKGKDWLVLDGVDLQAPNRAHYTTDGGATAADWTSVVPDPNGGWFGNQFSLLSNLHARAAGITYCESLDDGADWSCVPSVDNVFDGPVFFVNDEDGWVGVGEISPNVEGWVHRTSDGGTTWSGRTLDGGLPIREIRFLNAKVGWAVGGNIYTNVGGIYYSSDGGQTWSLDLDSSGAEMDACDSVKKGKNYQVWCAGYNSAFNGVVYTLQGSLN